MTEMRGSAQASLDFDHVCRSSYLCVPRSLAADVAVRTSLCDLGISQRIERYRSASCREALRGVEGHQHDGWEDEDDIGGQPQCAQQ